MKKTIKVESFLSQQIVQGILDKIKQIYIQFRNLIEIPLGCSDINSQQLSQYKKYHKWFFVIQRKQKRRRHYLYLIQQHTTPYIINYHTPQINIHQNQLINHEQQWIINSFRKMLHPILNQIINYHIKFSNQSMANSQLCFDMSIFGLGSIMFSVKNWKYYDNENVLRWQLRQIPKNKVNLNIMNYNSSNTSIRINNIEKSLQKNKIRCHSEGSNPNTNKKQNMQLPKKRTLSQLKLNRNISIQSNKLKLAELKTIQNFEKRTKIKKRLSLKQNSLQKSHNKRGHTPKRLSTVYKPPQQKTTLKLPKIRQSGKTLSKYSSQQYCMAKMNNKQGIMNPNNLKLSLKNKQVPQIKIQQMQYTQSLQKYNNNEQINIMPHIISRNCTKEQISSIISQIKTIHAQKLKQKQSHKQSSQKFMRNKMITLMPRRQFVFQHNYELIQQTLNKTHFDYRISAVNTHLIVRVNMHLQSIKKQIKKQGLILKQTQQISEYQLLNYKEQTFSLLEKLQKTLRQNQQIIAIDIKLRKERKDKINKANKQEQTKFWQYKYSKSKNKKHLHQNSTKTVLFVQTIQNQLINILNQQQWDSCDDQLQVLISKYSHQIYTYYLAYYYRLSQIIRAILHIFIQQINNGKFIVIQLTGIGMLTPDCDQYIDKCSNLLHFIKDLFLRIPIRAFKLNQNQQQNINKSIGKLKKCLKQCIPKWTIYLRQKYDQYQQTINRQDICGQLQKHENRRKNCKQQFNNQKFIAIQKQISYLQAAIDDIMKIKTYISIYKFDEQIRTIILDTNIVKQELISNLSYKIGQIYYKIYIKMKEIGNKWSKQMARTQRMLAYQIDYQRKIIENAINNYYQQFQKLFKICFIQRNYLYAIETKNNPMMIDHKTNLNQLFSSKNTDIILNSSRTTSMISDDAPNSQNMNIGEYLEYLYNMKKRTIDKMQQIAQISNIQEERMKIFSKGLQKQEFISKSKFIKMQARLENISKDIKSKADFLKFQQCFIDLQTQFRQYKLFKKQLQIQMEKNDIMIWQDDQTLEKGIYISLKIIKFLFSQYYRRFNQQTIDILTPNTFLNFILTFQKLQKQIGEHKFAIYFKQYKFTVKQKKLIEMCLYKSYNDDDKCQLQKLGINVFLRKTSMKAADIVSLYTQDPSIYDKILNIFYKRKGQNFTKKVRKIVSVEPKLSFCDEYGIQIIENFIQIEQLIIAKTDDRQWNSRNKKYNRMQLQVLYKVSQYSKKIIEYCVIYKNISDKYVRQLKNNGFMDLLDSFKQSYNDFCEKVSILQNFYLPYSPPQVRKAWIQLQNLDNKIKKIDLKSKLYYTFNEITPRSLLLDFNQLIKLTKWTNFNEVQQNIKNLFPEIESIQIQQSELTGIYVNYRYNKADFIEFKSNIIPAFLLANKNPHDMIKSIEQKITSSMKNMVDSSISRSGQIKILTLLLYFTQQVETSIFMNSSLEYLYKNLQQKINQISIDLRYDIKNHKQEQICQINTFLHYIKDKLGSYPAIDSFEWQSTIRYYEKSFQIIICKNNDVFSYRYEPKSIRILTNLDHKLKMQISCGDSNYMQSIKQISYALGVPFFRIRNIQNTFFGTQKNIHQALTTIKNNLYFVCIEHDYEKYNKNIYQLVHQSITHYSFSRKMNNLPKLTQFKQQRQVEHNNKFCLTKNSQPIPLYLIFPQAIQIPEYIKYFYSTHISILDSQSISSLKIHLLVHSNSKLQQNYKPELIRAFIKLRKVLLQLKFIPNQSLIKIFECVASKIQQISTDKAQFNKQMYKKLTQIVAQKSYLSYENIYEAIQKIFQFLQVSNMKEQQHKYPRQTLLKKLVQQIQDYLKYQKNNRTVIIYGVATTCKTTLIKYLIKNHNNFKLVYNDDLFENYLHLKQKDINDNQSSENISDLVIEDHLMHKIMQMSSLDSMTPKMVAQSYLLYVPQLQMSVNLIDELKYHYFMPIIEKLIKQNINSAIKVYVKQKIANFLNQLWDNIYNIYTAYKQIKQQYLQFHEILPTFLNIFEKTLKEYSLQKNQNWIQTDNQQVIQQQLVKYLKHVQQLLKIIIIEYFVYGFKNNHYKKLFYQHLGTYSQKNNHNSSKDIVDYSQLTYTTQGQIISINIKNKQKNNIIKKYYDQKSTNIYRKIFKIDSYRNLAKKYLQLQQSVIFWSSEQNYTRNYTIDQLSNNKEQKLVTDYIFSIKISKLMNTLTKINKINQMKVEQLNISKKTFRSRVMLQSAYGSKKVLFEDSKNQSNQNICIFIQDMHMGNQQQYTQIKALQQFANHPQKQLFIGFMSNKLEQKSAISNRFLRHFMQIVLPDLQLSSIFQNRNSIIGEDKNIFTQNVLDILGYQFDKQLKIKFILDTTLVIPSLTYYKYIYIAIIKMFLNPLNTNTYKQPIIMKPSQIITKIRQKPKILQKFTKIIGKEVYLLENSRGTLYEPETIGIKQRYAKFMHQLDQKQKYLCQKMLQFVPLTINKGTYLVRGDIFMTYGKLVANISNKKIFNLTQDYMAQLVDIIQDIMYNKNQNVICVIPSYLSKNQSFLNVLKSINKFGQIIFGCEMGSYQCNYLWALYCQCIKRKQYVENLCNQQISVKNQIQNTLINKIIYLVYVDDFKSTINKLSEDDPNNQTILNMTLIDLQLNIDEKLQYTQKLIKYHQKLAQKALMEITNDDDRIAQVQKLGNVCLKLFDALKCIIIKISKKSRQSDSYNIVNCIQRIFEQMTQYLVNQKSKFAINQSESRVYNNEIRNIGNIIEQPIKALKVIQIFYKKIKIGLHNKQKYEKYYKKYGQCLQKLKNNFKNISEDSDQFYRGQSEMSQIQTYTYRKILQKANFINKQFTQHKNKFIQSFQYPQISDNKQHMQIIEQLQNYDYHNNTIQQLQTNCEFLGIVSEINRFQGIIWAYPCSQQLSNYSQYKNTDKIQTKSDHQFHKISNYHKFNQLIDYIRQTHQLFTTKIKPDITQLIHQHIIHTITDQLIDNYHKLLYRKQVMFAQYLHLVRTIEQVNAIMEAIKIQINNQQQNIENMTKFIEFLLQKDGYQFIRTWYRGQQSKVCGWVINIRDDKFFEDDGQYYGKKRISKKQSSQLIMTNIYKKIVIYILSQIPSNYSLSQQIKKILKIQKQISSTKQLIKYQKSTTTKLQVINQILFYQENYYRQHRQIQKQKEHKIIQRKNRNYLPFSNQLKDNTALLLRNNNDEQFYKNMMGIQYIPYRNAQTQLINHHTNKLSIKNTHKTKQIQQKQYKISDIMRNINIPIAIYDEGGDILKFINNNRNLNKFKVYQVKQYDSQALQNIINNQKQGLQKIIDYLYPNIGLLNHVPTFYLYHFGSQIDLARKQTNINILKQLIKYLRIKQSSFHDHLLIFVDDADALGEIKQSVNQERLKIKTWSLLYTEMDFYEQIRQIFTNGTNSQQELLNENKQNYQYFQNKLYRTLQNIAQIYDQNNLSAQKELNLQFLISQSKQCNTKLQAIKQQIQTHKFTTQYKQCCLNQYNVQLIYHKIYTMLKQYRVSLSWIRKLQWKYYQPIIQQNVNQGLQNIVNTLDTQRLLNQGMVLRDQTILEYLQNNNMVIIVYQGDMPPNFMEHLYLILNKLSKNIKTIFFNPQIDSNPSAQQPSSSYQKLFYKKYFQKICYQINHTNKQSPQNKQYHKKYVIITKNAHKKLLGKIYHLANVLYFRFQMHQK